MCSDLRYKTFNRNAYDPFVVKGTLLDSLTANAAGNIQQVATCSSYEYHQITSDNIRTCEMTV